MYNEDFIEVFGNHWSVFQKDNYCLAVGMPLIVILCEDEKVGRNFMVEHTVLPEDIMIIVIDMDGNIEKIIYEKQEQMAPKYEYEEIAQYLSRVRGYISLSDIEQYVLQEDEDNLEPIQRIGTNQIERIMSELEEFDEHEGMVLRNGGWNADKLWYRVNDEIDPEIFYKKTALFGIFGWHKFANKEYMQGFLYFFTCGFCGVAVIIDLIMMLTGRYSYKKVEYSDGTLLKRSVEKVYLKKAEIKKIYAVLGIIIPLILALIFEMIILPTITGVISSGISSILRNTSENNPEAFKKVVGFVQK